MPLQPIGRRIRLYRKTQHITQKDLADKAECTQTFLSQLENSVKQPSIEMLYKIATALDTPIAEFLKEERAED